MIRGSHVRIARVCAVLGLLVACATPALAQEEAAVVRRASELRESANASSRSLAALPAQSQVVRVGERQGPWVQVRAAGNQTGWVHMFDLAAPGTTAAPSGTAATGTLRGVTNFLRGSGGTNPTVPTSTIGIRGLDAEDLANARPDMDAVARLEAMRLSEAQARDFASHAPLIAVSVPALPAPAVRTSGSPGSTSGSREAP